MPEPDDNTLIALGLIEHAQTCDDIAGKYAFGSDGAKQWRNRAERCRDLAKRYQTAARPSDYGGQA